MRPYNAENVRFNKDEKQYIDDKDEVRFNSVHLAINDLKGNGKDWIMEAVEKSFEKHEQKFCEEHRKDVAKVKKKLKIHDWWLWAITITIFVVILIMSL